MNSKLKTILMRVCIDQHPLMIKLSQILTTSSWKWKNNSYRFLNWDTFIRLLITRLNVFFWENTSENISPRWARRQRLRSVTQQGCRNRGGRRTPDFGRSFNPISNIMPTTLLLDPPSLTVCWNGVLRGHFLGIKMQHWINVQAHFLKIGFWSTLSTLHISLGML